MSDAETSNPAPQATVSPTKLKKPSRRKRPTRRSMLLPTLIIIVSLAAGFAGGYIGARSTGQHSSGTAISKADQDQAKSQSQLISAIAKKVSPSVVSVNVTSQASSRRGVYQQESAGTGIIISDDGYVITNRHVVPAGTTKVSVTLSDGTELTDVTVIGRTSDADTLDIAFLKINDTKGVGLQKVELGDSSKVQVGDKVVAIGNALGQFQNTVTDGIISGYGRNLQAGDESGNDIESLQNLFQTDAAINAGNSGGPLLNIDGQVIGINTAVAGGTAQNIGFAIPINDVSGLIKTVLEKGKLERPYLGVRYVTLTDDVASQYGLSIKRGAYIVPAESGLTSIVAGSPADKAGLKEGDVITKIDGTAVDESNSLTSLIGRKSVGDTIKVTINRGNKQLVLDVILQAAPVA